MRIEILLVIAIAGIAAVYAYRQFSQGPKPYRARICQGQHWRDTFPTQDKKDIRLFLECLTMGMGLSPKLALKFRPNDKVLDIYKSLYGGKVPIADNMECEEFLDALSDCFDVNIEQIHAIWNEDITLGDLYRQMSIQ